MIITLKELVSLLNLSELAPIHYQTREDLNKENNIFFKFMSSKEKKDLESKVWNENIEYPKEELGVYIPDLSIDEFMALEEERNYINQIINMISYKIKIPISEYSLIFAVFCLLHEVGHWIQFVDMGMTSYEYFQWDKKYRLDLVKEGKIIYNMPDYSYEKRKLVINWNERYRKIPSEEKADQYALEHIIESMNFIRKHYGFKNDIG